MMEAANKAIEHSSASTAGSHRLRPTRQREQHLDGSKPDTIHERLDDPSGQIRLLVATASSQNDILSFEISTHSLAEVPDYHAISYTWGQDDTQRSVLINGVEFCVNQNCYYALWQACLHYPETPLWIDSLCIDQNHSTEKSAQVWIMPEIYRGASRVLACIGPHADDSMVLAPTVPELKRLKKLENIVYVATYSLIVEERGFAQLVHESLGLETLSRLFNAFDAFKRRLYWKRLWIQQEIGLATEVDVLCGNDLLFWRSMTLLYELYGEIPYNIILRQEQQYEAALFELYHEIASARGPFDELISLLQHDEFELGRLLSFSRGLDCADFHDRVYGVLGLARPWIRKHLLPDYDLSATQLALQVANVLPFHRSNVIIENLEIHIEDEELRHLVERVHSCDATWNDVASRKHQRCSCYSMREHREYKIKEPGAVAPSYQAFAPCHQYTMRTNGDGQLTIALKDSSYFDEDSFNKRHDSLSTSALLSDAKRIVVDDRIVGFVCQTARDGDVILNLSGMNSGNFLVLRHSKGEFYDLVGWGFLLPGYCLRLIDIPVRKWSELSFGGKAVEVRISISPQETIAFWATEMQERGTEGLERMINMIARLDSSITNHPHGAVQIKDLPIG